MKLYTLLLFVTLVVFIDCNQKQKSDHLTQASESSSISEGPKSTILATLKSFYRYKLSPTEKDIIFEAQANFRINHKDEIIKTIELVDSVPVPGLEITLAFYRYSIGTDIVREAQYFKNENGKWYMYYKYFNSYSDDPFENGKGPEAKLLLKKVEDWEDGNKKLWWY